MQNRCLTPYNIAARFALDYEVGLILIVPTDFCLSDPYTYVIIPIRIL